MTGCGCVPAVINRKIIHTIDWNRGFEPRIAHMYTHTGSSVLFFCVGGGRRTGGLPLIRGLQKIDGVFSEIGSGT